MKRVAALSLAVVSAFLSGVGPTSAASNAWFRWPGKPKIVLTIRVPQQGLLPSFQRAAAAWGLSPAFTLTVSSQSQCPAVKQISVCNDPQGTETQGNPAATSPTLLNAKAVSATIWVFDSWVSSASTSELDYMACHELGHALGLAHQSVLDSCMSYAFARPFPNAQDYRTLGEMYGLPASTDPALGAAQAVPPQPVPPAAPSSQICAPAPSTATGPSPDVLSYGDAGFFGSTGGVRLTRPIVGMAATPTGTGYWTVASDGGIFAFGDARFFGSTGNIRLNRPVVALAPTASGNGYWMYASDGGIFTYGDAPFRGSGAGLDLGPSVVGVAASPTGQGYWMAGSAGTVAAFGDARCYGSIPALDTTASQVQALVATPSGGGYWLATRRTTR